MPVRNLHWYNRNTTRDYPLADQATAMSVRAQRLPTNILADLSLRYPQALGALPYLAAITVTPSLVSLTIQAAGTLADLTTLAPVAVLSLPQPVQPWRHYALQPQYPGAGGWVVFGEGVAEAFTGRFLPEAGLLVPRAARAYRPLPVADFGKLHTAQALTGIVRLRGESPVAIVAEDREIEGITRTVAVIRLTSPAETTTQSVLQEFLLPCSQRPESRTCLPPVPIEAINAVAPDCRGNIMIVLAGCAELAANVDGHGVVVDCGLGLADACVPSTLPAADGRLRTEYDDQCESELSAVSEPIEPPIPIVSAESETSQISETVEGELPYSQTFSDCLPDDWHTAAGAFELAADDPPGSEAAGCCSTEPGGSGQRNLSLWSGFDPVTTGRRYVLAVKMRAGTRHNAGLVLNYRPSTTYIGFNVYYLIEIDRDAMQFRIMRYNGSTMVLTSAFVDLTNLQLERWYQIEVVTELAGGGDVNITATLTALEGPALSATIGPLRTGQYLPDTGKIGIHADRANSRFGFLIVREEA